MGNKSSVDQIKEVQEIMYNENVTNEYIQEKYLNDNISNEILLSTDYTVIKKSVIKNNNLLLLACYTRRIGLLNIIIKLYKETDALSDINRNKMILHKNSEGISMPLYIFSKVLDYECMTFILDNIKIDKDMDVGVQLLATYIKFMMTHINSIYVDETKYYYNIFDRMLKLVCTDINKIVIDQDSNNVLQHIYTYVYKYKIKQEVLIILTLMLFDHKININYINKNGNCVLFNILDNISPKYYDTIFNDKYFLSTTDFNAKTLDNQNVLHYIFHPQVVNVTNIFDSIIDKIKDFDLLDKEGKTPLQFAVFYSDKGFINIAKKLIDRGADWRRYNIKCLFLIKSEFWYLYENEPVESKYTNLIMPALAHMTQMLYNIQNTLNKNKY
jgi:hypothetical protein